MPCASELAAKERACYESQENIAASLATSLRTTQRALDRLVQLNLIEEIPRKHQTTIYRPRILKATERRNENPQSDSLKPKQGINTEREDINNLSLS